MLWILSAIACCIVAGLASGQSSCPGNAQQRIMECSRPLMAFGQALSPAEQQAHCGDARRAMACVRDVVGECQGIEGTTLEQMMNSFNQMERQLNTVCGEPAPVESVTMSNTVSSCSKRDQRKLQKCSRRMQRYAAESPIRCGKMTKALDCMETLIERCSTLIDQGITSRVASIRENVMQICVGPNEPVDENMVIEDEEELTNPNLDSDGEVTVVNECPAGYNHQMMACVQPMRQMDSSDLVEMCRIANMGLDCINNIIAMCPDKPNIQEFVNTISMDEMTALVNRNCPSTGTNNTDTDCPAGYTQSLMDCTEPMKSIGPGHSQNIGEMCGIMTTSLECIQDIVDKCPNEPGVSSLTRLANLDQIQGFVNARCSGGPMPTSRPTGGSNENCPSRYTQQMMACVEPMRNLGRSTSQNKAEACRIAEEGFECLDTILSDCGGKPEVQKLTSMLNIDEMRTMIDTECSTSTSNNCSVANPTAELEKCNDFLVSFQQGGRSMETRCRILDEGFDCFRNLIDSCPLHPAVTAFTSIVDVDEARESLSVYCPNRK